MSSGPISSRLESPGVSTDGERSPTIMVPTDPFDWTSENIVSWLSWAGRKLEGVGHVQPELLPSKGRDLCSLSQEDFVAVAGGAAGQLLHTHLAILRGQNVEAATPFSYPATPSPASPATCSTPPTPLCDPRTTPPPSATSPGFELDYRTFLPAPSGGQIQLWQFLLELLDDNTNSDILTWEGEKGEFRLIDPDDVARKWGERKNKQNMNYDKLSRALRYYYDKNILTKIPGKRYAYRFDFHCLQLACQAQQSPTPSDTKLTELTGILAPFLSPAPSRISPAPSRPPSIPPRRISTEASACLPPPPIYQAESIQRTNSASSLVACVEPPPSYQRTSMEPASFDSFESQFSDSQSQDRNYPESPEYIYQVPMSHNNLQLSSSALFHDLEDTLSIWDHPELYSSPFHANQTSFHANTVSHPHSSVDGTLVTHASVPNLNVQAADTFSSHNHLSAPDLHQACLAGQVTGSTNYFGFSENLDECGIERSNSVPANFNQF